MTTPTDRKPTRPEQATLFDLPAEPGPRSPAPPSAGTPRLRRADRHQVVFRSTTLDALLPDDHDARIIWAYVEGLDLDPLYGAIGSVQGGSGRAATDPRILLALWLYATAEGVGSARELDRLCRDHVAYQWIAGDVRDELPHPGRLPHRSRRPARRPAHPQRRHPHGRGADRAEPGGPGRDAGPRRRRGRLVPPAADPGAGVTAGQGPGRGVAGRVEADPAAADRRQKAARERAARERAERIKAALARLPELEARKKAEEVDEARCSTTDPEATVMKMADGGFRPAYNVQFATTVGGQVIVGVDVIAAGQRRRPDGADGRAGPRAMRRGAPGDAGRRRLRAARPDRRGERPGGRMHGVRAGARAEGPEGGPARAEAGRQRGGGGVAGADGDGRRRRRSTRAGRRRRNASTRWRGAAGWCGSWCAGLAKVRAVALWQAVAHNVMRGATLRAAAAGRG